MPFITKLARISSRTMTTNAFKASSGTTIPVWEAKCPQSSYPKFDSLKKNESTSICIVGTGIAGITTAYEAKKAFGSTRPIVLIDARSILSGETQRTTGHLSSGDQGDRFYNLIKIHGEQGAREAYESHQYAVEQVGHIAKELGIDCEYRQLPAKVIKAPEEENDLEEEYKALQRLNIPSTYEEKGKVGVGYRGPVLTIEKQGTFHPTKYLVGILEYLQKQSDFKVFTETRYVSHSSKDGKLEVSVLGDSGEQLTITCDDLVLATNMPPRKFSEVIKQHYMRTYAIAMTVPKGKIEDILLYDNKDPYVYVRKSAHKDDTKEYLIIGGEDHKVGIENQEGYETHFANLAKWAREHFPEVGEVEYEWSGQVVENAEGLAYIGQSGETHEYIITGDNGNGLTHGTLAARLITDLLGKRENAWQKLYDPARKPTKAGLSGLYETAKENIIQQKEYVRLAHVDVSDIEDIPVCSGAVIRGGLTSGMKPIAVYKDEKGKVCKFSALCPHLKGVVAWNPVEKSWDCPNHGSRFAGTTGECVMGPAKMGLSPENEVAEGNAAETANV